MGTKKRIYVLYVCKYFLFHLVIAVRPDLWFFLVLENRFLFLQNCARGEKSYTAVQIHPLNQVEQKLRLGPLRSKTTAPSIRLFWAKCFTNSSAAVVSHHVNNLIFTREATWTGFSYPNWEPHLFDYELFRSGGFSCSGKALGYLNV